MTDTPGSASTRTSRTIRATPETLFAACVDAEALVEWLPPAEMTGVMHAFDARVGGGYRMSLFDPSTGDHHPGKTSAHEDAVEVRFVELTPPHRIVEAIRFASDDPAFGGEMRLTVTFDAVAGGTEVTLAFDDIPPGIRPEDNDEGAHLSLAQLARRYESHDDGG